MTKPTKKAIDVRSNTDITELPDGQIKARLEVMDVEGIGPDRQAAGQVMVNALMEKINSDEEAAKRFNEWAAEHTIEVEMTDEDIAEEARAEKLRQEAKDATKDFADLTPDTFAAAIASTKPVLVDFWAAWCRPCLNAAPVLADIHAEMADRFDVAKVNVEEFNDLGTKHGVQGIPCFVMFQNGAEVDRIVGFAPKAEFQAEIEKVLAKAT